MAVPLAISDTFYTILADEPGYDAACNFTSSTYRSKLDCKLSSFYPRLNVLEGTDGIESVCGLREAGKETLFLEQYLDRPVETLIGDAFNEVSRTEIVEIGGFASVSRIAALHLMGLTAVALREEGYRYVVCTANRSIRCCLHKLGIRFEELAVASSNDLSGVGKDEWGRYYETAPLVLAGSITEGAQVIEHFA